MRILVLMLFSFLLHPHDASSQAKTDDREIAEAVSALPQALRDGATVRAIRQGRLVTIRVGTNGLICLGDNPAEERWHVACYHESLDPFMERGRALRAQGVTERAAIDSIRMAEVEAGRLSMPSQPTALYSLFANDGVFDPASGEAAGARGLYVIYMPYASEATTGISAVPSQERPWLMFPGKPWAHVMISR